jgi:mono/diheme cytochrome c family protein
LRPIVVGPTLAAVLLMAGCAASTPEVPAGPDGSRDPVLVAGRDVYTDRCANCHGSAGGGDRGPRIAGDETLEDYPDVADLVDFVEAGKGSMPGFGDELNDAELEAVARFIREVL